LDQLFVVVNRLVPHGGIRPIELQVPARDLAAIDHGTERRG